MNDILKYDVSKYLKIKYIIETYGCINKQWHEWAWNEYIKNSKLILSYISYNKQNVVGQHLWSLAKNGTPGKYIKNDPLSEKLIPICRNYNIITYVRQSDNTQYINYIDISSEHIVLNIIEYLLYTRIISSYRSDSDVCILSYLLKFISRYSPGIIYYVIWSSDIIFSMIINNPHVTFTKETYV